MSTLPPMHEESVILEMKATTKEAALRELAALAAVHCGLFTEEVLYNLLLEREAVGSTGVGNGAAIPHGKINGLDKLLFCFGRSRAGLNFDAIDNRPVHLFALLLSPASLAAEYLHGLAHLSRVLRDDNSRQRLMESTARKEIAALFNQVPDRA